MKTVVGIFRSRQAAEGCIPELRNIGVDDPRINLLAPGASDTELAAIPTTEAEQPGMGKALGAVVGGAVGASVGLPLGAVASLMIPGVGPVVAIGMAAAALLGIGGAAAGATLAGEPLEDSLREGLPKDEVFVYEDALRQGRTVLIALVETEAQENAARDIMNDAGAETIDAARESWWVGLRDAEEEEYRRDGGDFRADEQTYRRGFETALRAEMRGKRYDELSRESVHGVTPHEEPTFRRGYEHGRTYWESWQRRPAA